MKITDLAYKTDTSGNKVIVNPWRADLQLAHFRDAYFHTDGNSLESGRRIVVHEFPKRNIPYAEDMGRRAYEFTVRGYCIQYPEMQRNQGPGLNQQPGSELQRKDYRIARDRLIDELSSGKPGTLYLPTYKGRPVEMVVACPRFRVSEEERLGGYAVFDMTFVEQGTAPTEAPPDPRDVLLKQLLELRERTKEKTAPPPAPAPVPPGGVNA